MGKGDEEIVHGKGAIECGLKPVKRYSTTLLKGSMSIPSPKILVFTYEISRDLKKREKAEQHVCNGAGRRAHRAPPPTLLAGVQTDSALIQAIWQYLSHNKHRSPLTQPFHF